MADRAYLQLRAKVITTALYSRVAVIALSCISNLFIPNHDPGAFTWTPSSDGGVSFPTIADRLINLVFDGLTIR